jgi:CubicO group peptidase (beta-lactamase class C family)
VLEHAFRRLAEEAQERWNVPAIAVGVSLDGRRETLSLGCDPDTRFRIASVTKPFTASLALALLDLDAPAGTWPGVTPRHLLSHTAGYDCELGDLRRFGDGDDALPGIVSELGRVRRWTDPGVVWSYSNASYWLAGQLAAEQAGTTYEDAVMEHVCARAGLEATAFSEPDLDGFDVDLHAGGLVLDTAGPYPRARRPSGGLSSTVGDLLRFGEWQLAEPATAALRVPHALRPGGGYGLGFMVDAAGGDEVWFHGGDYGGFQSTLVLVPAARLVFTGLTNSRTGSQVLRILREEVLERAVGSRTPPPEPVRLPEADLDAFAGRYAHPEAEIRVEVVDDGLTVQELDEETVEPAFRARPLVGGEFEIVEGPFSGSRFDFPLPGFGRFSSRLAERVG